MVNRVTRSREQENRKRKLYEVHTSPIHGRGVFASQSIPKGARIIEYTGERITPQEADTRYDDDRVDHPHVVLFTVDKHTVIDGAVGGNEARFINHSCEPNCEAVLDEDEGRIFIESLKVIPRGAELTYDYKLERPGRYQANWAERYRCNCGAPGCRGTMLAPRKTRARSTRSRQNRKP